jgi:hypothetical protein
MKKEIIKTLSIGDIHGLSVWKTFGDISKLITYSGVKPEYDYYVFVGDYVDSFTLSNVEILANLKDIVEFKINYPDNVILLWGNHDVQYYTSYTEHGCSGFRREAYFDLHEQFRKHRKLFQMGFQIENHLWTHAGVHSGWYYHRFPYNTNKIADDLNLAFEEGNATIFDVGRMRGGFKDVGGPLWADKNEIWKKALRGYHQIVGHTRTNKIIHNKINKNTSITYIDVLENNAMVEPYVLEIDNRS